MRVLIVEDQEDLAEAIAGRLQKRGYAVDIAMDGSEADELLRRSGAGAAFLDHGGEAGSAGGDERELGHGEEAVEDD